MKFTDLAQLNNVQGNLERGFLLQRFTRIIMKRLNYLLQIKKELHVQMNQLNIAAYIAFPFDPDKLCTLLKKLYGCLFLLG